MIQTGIESRVKIQDVISSQLPNFILDESPKTVDFLKQYYISQEYQSGVVDIVENLDQYLNLDNLTPEIIVDKITTTGVTTIGADTLQVNSTKGFPNQYGLLKIGNEIITYTGLTTNTFTGLTRGFSGITSYRSDLNEEELVFSTTDAEEHDDASSVQNLSKLFLKEFYNKFKRTFAPGFENLVFDSDLNVGNFLKEIKSFYESKGTDDAIKILFRVLYGVNPKIINLEDLLFKPSAAEYLRRETVIVEVLSGNPIGLVGQTIKKIEKLNDPETQASVSEVEPFTRQGKQFFKFQLFVGYGGASLVEGNFKITPSTKAVVGVSTGSVLTVDSTIGFPQKGTVISGINTISYTDKTLNQFLGCSGIENTIKQSDIIYSDEIYFGFEDGDLNKKVEFRITGIISKFKQTSENVNVSEGDVISIKNIGVKVENPTVKDRREVFANSWIYNTSSFFEIENIVGGDVFLKTPVDRSTLKVGDFVEFVDRNNPSEVVYPSATDSQPYVTELDEANPFLVKVNNVSNLVFQSGDRWNLRRKINTPFSNSVPLSIDNITSDVTNVYFDSDNGYTASNSLPSKLNSNISNIPFFENIATKLNKITLLQLEDLNDVTKKYRKIKVSEAKIPLLTGDEIYYESTGATFNQFGTGDNILSVGISTGSYFIEVLGNQLIKLYSSRSFIQSGTGIEIELPKDNSGNTISATHTFTLYSQRSNKIEPAKSFKKFPLSPNLKNGGVNSTLPGTIGKLINGVEIFNYKTSDKIYFGPLSKVNVLSGGSGYDVINPPIVEVNDSVGAGASVQPCVSGKVVDALIGELPFDLDRVVSIGVTGGNGTGAVIEPIIGKRSREILFEATPFTSEKQFGIGSADNDLTILTFKGRHNLISGDRVIYNSNGNISIGQTFIDQVVTGTGTTSENLGIFSSNQEYFVSVVNEKSVRFFRTKELALSQVRDEAVGLANTEAGIQKLIVGSPNNTILGINVVSSGQNYENRKLFVQPTGISTIFNQITFENHNFRDGDKIVYEHIETKITGLSTAPNQQYMVTRIDNNTFKLSDAGIGGTTLSNYNQKIFVDLQSAGIGTQTFKYPDIKAFVEYVGVTTGTVIQGTNRQVVAEITPVVKGEISDLYLHEKGTGYGSQILNFENNPLVTIKNGANASIAELTPIIDVNTGGISTVTIDNKGSGYFSTPDLEVVDSLGIGNGAKLRAIITEKDGQLTGSVSSVEIISAGIGYSASTTSIQVKPSGNGAVITTNVRELNVNNTLKYGESFLKDESGKIKTGMLEENNGILQNVVTGYSVESFKEVSNNISKIIGWAYDGNPIYGPYGYEDPEKKTNAVKLLVSGYELKKPSVNRPSGDDGFFVEDYVFTNNGDLDEYNGRFEINDDYPNGVYAYHATVDSNGVPQFPYFIGNKYRSKVENDNFSLNQSFDFQNSSLRRNTLPYNVSEKNAGNDFITEANNLQSQQIEIETVESGSVNSLEITEGGTNQKVGDVLNFDNVGTGGDGLIAKVDSIKGEPITNIVTDVLKYNDAVITKEDNNTLRITPSDNHNLTNGDLVVLSGLTSSLSDINGSYIIGVTSITGTLQVAIAASNSASPTTEIYTDLASKVSIGDSIRIGTEALSVLNTYDQKNIITVLRDIDANITHSVSSPIYVVPNSFTVQKSVDKIKSTVNQKQFFNPINAVGFGTTAGQSVTKTLGFGATTITRNVPMKGIYLENHPFVTNQKLVVVNDGNPIGVSNTSLSTVTAMPSTVFAVRKNRNVVGIKTLIGGPEVFLYDRVGSDVVSDSDQYLFKSTFVQEKVDVKNVKNTVTLGSSFHQLKDNDLITLDIRPNISVGIGSLSEVTLRRDSNRGYILADPVQCLVGNISVAENKINLENHRLKTGDKVQHFSTLTAVGIGNSSYFVSVIDDDNFNLCDSFENATANPPVVFDILAVSGIATQVHTFEKINPQIEVEKNSNLVFDISDNSLSGYKFKIFHDRELNNEFVSTGSSIGFNVPIDATNKLTVGFGNSLPEKLYYGLEKVGVAVTADNTVRGYSEIVFVDNNLKGTHKISNVGVNTFTFDSLKEPRRLTTTSDDCDILSYSTKSGIVTGAINSVNIITGGSNFKKLPSFVSVGTTTIRDVNILPKSKTIGNIKKTRVINEGFEYSSDPTLQPEALIPSFVQLRGSKKISSVEIVNGGSDYLNPPSLVVVDTETGRVFEDSALEATLVGTSINSVKVESSPSGLSVARVGLFTTENSNGISIQKVESTPIAGIAFTVSISKPAGGYAVNPFKIGDSVFIEGLQKVVGSAGSGFNSEDYGFKFLSVTNYDDSGALDKITIDVSQYTSSTGQAIENVDSFAQIVNSTDYPSFRLNLVESGFTIGEKILIGGIERDLTVVQSGENFVKLIGLFDLNNNDIIVGAASRNKGIIQNLFKNEGQFEVNYSLIKDLGWENNVGKLNEDIQVLADNDYYQNLSYSIQSPITWNDLKSPVNNLVHTSGFKNFADTGITSTSSAFPGIGTAKISVFVDVIPELFNLVRVDTLYNFDNARDTFTGLSTVGAGTSTGLVLDEKSSKFIQLETIRLTDFVEAKTNNVLNIDNISSLYSNLETNPNLFTNLLQVEPVDGLNRVLAAVRDTESKQNQLSELIVLNNNAGVYLLEKNKSSISNVGLGTNNEDFTNFTIEKVGSNNFIRFTPTNQFKFDVDYDIKLAQSKFNSTLTGTGSSAFGFVNLTGSVVGVASTTDAAGTNVAIASTTSTNVRSIFVNSQVTDLVTNEMNFVETLLGVGSTTGDTTFISQSFFDSNQGSFSNNFIGTFGASLSSGVLSLNFTNKGSNDVRIRSNIIGFGYTSAGTATHRFLASGQASGSERTQLFESKHDTQIGISTIGVFDKNTFSSFKSTVSVVSTSGEALHQVFGVIHLDAFDTVFLNQNQFLSGGTAANPGGNTPAGIGTFKTRFVGNNVTLEFVPDVQDTAFTTVKAFNEVFYRDTDEKTAIGRVNNPLPLNVGKITQSSDLKLYNSLNGNRINRRDFELTSNGTPIFAKTFDPTNTGIVNFATGKFTINDHFFRTNEELIYTPQSSFVGVGSTAMMFKHAGDTNTSPLPTTVFAIKENDNVFSISTTSGGSAVTFVDAGEGNNHQFAMSKSLTKALITIDGLVQHPIAQTNIVFQVANNGASISAASTIFSLSNVSNINIEDVLKIDDEFIRVTNVGLGTLAIGPISGLGTFPLINGQRGYIGTKKATHGNVTDVKVFRGAYNIVGNEIHFTEAPRGNTTIDFDDANLPPAKSDFEGRVYFRNDYTTNKIYDDISNQFTGIGQTFELKSGGSSTTGIGNTGGNGILFVNNIFQRPTTLNNADGNFDITDDGTSGITTVTFSGIRQGELLFQSSRDINQNDLPRGGVIVSLGSKGGLGYAPLEPALVRPQTTLAGTISTIVGVAHSGVQNGITTAAYDHLTGLLDITTVNKHNLRIGYNDEVSLTGLGFTCTSSGVGIGSGVFPDGTIGNKFSVVGITSERMFTTQVGTSTIPHTYLGGGFIRKWYGNLTFGSGYNNVSIAASVFDPGYEHVFASATTNSVTANTGAQFTPSNATYDPVTGDLVLFINGHGLTGSNTVTIATGSISFTCSKDSFRTNHAYPRAGDPAAGQTLSITSFTTNSITVNVGKNVGTGATITATVGVGGTLIFNIVSGGTNYKEPEIFVPSPSYDDMEIEGISRIGFGTGPDTGIGALISVEVGSSGLPTGIGSTLFSVKNFELSRTGYNFRKGDKFTPVGLVTAKGFASPVTPFILEVEEVYQDNFSSWQFGEFDFIDTIKPLQDGSRTVFPLFYNGELLSIQAQTGSNIISENLLLIFVNGVNQKPGVNYQFDGGTIFSFTTAPTADDDVAIYFYKGSGADAVVNTSVNKVIEEGDTVQLVGVGTILTQNERTVVNLTTKDRFETDLYTSQGINPNDYRPMHLNKQKVDKIINSRVIAKTRDSIAAQIVPTAKVISDITTNSLVGSDSLYVDDISLFNYEHTTPDFPITIISNAVLPTVGSLTATVGSGTTISTLTIVSGGSNYTSAPTVTISPPPTIGVGVGTTATATLTVSNGVINGFAITNPGLGYTVAPSVLVKAPTTSIEKTDNIGFTTGFTTRITRIVVGTGGTDITFTTKRDDFTNYTGLNFRDYVFVKNTTVGHGVTSLNETGLSNVCIGSTFFDNVYQVFGVSNTGKTGTIRCRAIASAIDVGTISTTAKGSLGTLSFGKLSQGTRGSNPISIGVTGLTVDVGLTTFPTIKRSGGDYTLRNTGALPKTV